MSVNLFNSAVYSKTIRGGSKPGEKSINSNRLTTVILSEKY